MYFLPKLVIQDIDKVMKRFLWNVGEKGNVKAKIAWKVVCRPKDQGGLGIKPLKEWNEVLLMKHVWNIIINKQSLWVQWVNRVKLKQRSFWSVEVESSDSWSWKKFLALRDKMRPFVWHELGNGQSTSVWFDKWDHKGPLSKFITSRDLYDARYNKESSVADLQI